MQDGYDQTLSGLLRKRAELAAAISTNRAKLDADLIALTSIESAIRVFNPDLMGELLPCNRDTVPHQAATGEISRFLMDALRTRESRTIRTLEAADDLMRAKDMDPRDRVVATLVRKRVTDAFRRLRKAGIVDSRRYGAGTELEWRLTAISAIR